MRSQEVARNAKNYTIKGTPAIESPSGNLTLPLLELTFSDRGKEGNEVRNLMIENLLELKDESMWGEKKEALLKEYSENQLSLVTRWFQFYNWRIDSGVKPEEKEDSWLLSKDVGSSPECMYPHRWLNLWEKLIVRGFNPSVLDFGCVHGFPPSPPSLGQGKILLTAEGVWKYIWREVGAKGEMTTGSKLLNNRVWGPDTEIGSKYDSIFQVGFEKEPLLLEDPAFKVQVNDAKRGWLDDWGFHTLENAKLYLKEEKITNGRIMNTQSNCEVNVHG